MLPAWVLDEIGAMFWMAAVQHVLCSCPLPIVTDEWCPDVQASML